MRVRAGRKECDGHLQASSMYLFLEAVVAAGPHL